MYSKSHPFYCMVLQALTNTLYGHVTVTMIMIQNSSITPRNSLLTFVVNSFSYLPVPGNHWSVFCPYSFPFPEYHVNRIKKSLSVASFT